MTTEELKDYMDERTHDMETRLLGEIRKYATLIQSLMKVQRTRTDGVEDRLSMIEERLSNLEDK